jgi:hypothetical protein
MYNPKQVKQSNRNSLYSIYSQASINGRKNTPPKNQKVKYQTRNTVRETPIMYKYSMAIMNRHKNDSHHGSATLPSNSQSIEPLSTQYLTSFPQNWYHSSKPQPSYAASSFPSVFAFWRSPATPNDRPAQQGSALSSL